MPEISQHTLDLAYVVLAQDLVREIKQFWHNVPEGDQKAYDNRINIIDTQIDAIKELHEKTKVFKAWLDKDLLDKEWVRNDIQWHSPRPPKVQA